MTSARRDVAFVRAVTLLSSALLVGCAAGELADASFDADSLRDAGGDDAGGIDGGGTDSGTDGGPPDMVGLCETCSFDEECGIGNFCALMTTGEHACVQSCNPDLPTCSLGFSCVLDFGSGVSEPVCLPVGEGCCIDEDTDEYGQGIGCVDTDCADDDPLRNPGMTETCNGIDEDCDGIEDDPPTDCATGRCTADGDGTYTAVEGADCVDAMCDTTAAGDTEDCILYTCDEGGPAGTICAPICDPAGMDDNLYCIEIAHCDAGTCLADEPDGGTCDEDTDCAGGRCDNGFCCAGGTCCGVTADCPGGGDVTTICDDAATCSGFRGETQCNTAHRCEALSGIPDDSACTSTTEARTCDPYDPIFCNGNTTQSTPTCPTSCTDDDECIASAHCEAGLCLPDRDRGEPCTVDTHCTTGFVCTDNVCCDGRCDGLCEACDLTGTRGTCALVAATDDPDEECSGYSCASYYGGFMAPADVCYDRGDVSNLVAACNGGGVCISPSIQCPMQPADDQQIDCNDFCQTPVPGTCTGLMPGQCANLDATAGNVSCGMGICRNTVARCVGGALNTCNQLPPRPGGETCNNLDDDCDGVTDDGGISQLCTIPPGADPADIVCNLGACQLMCDAPQYDLNGTYSDGCECTDDSYGNGCNTATSLGNVMNGSMAYSGNVIPNGETDWFRVSFPSVGRGSGNGAPRIALSPGASTSQFSLRIYTSCSGVNGGTVASCGGGSAAPTDTYEFRDNADSTGGYTSNGVTWPSTIFFSVTRDAPTTLCGSTAYTFSISR